MLQWLVGYITTTVHDVVCMCYVGTLLGPYYGKAVKKEYADEETHEWLWEVCLSLTLVSIAL